MAFWSSLGRSKSDFFGALLLAIIYYYASYSWNERMFLITDFNDHCDRAVRSLSRPALWQLVDWCTLSEQ